MSDHHDWPNPWRVLFAAVVTAAVLFGAAALATAVRIVWVANTATEAPPSPLVAKCTAWEGRRDLVVVTAHFRQPYGAPAVPAETWHPPQEREE